METGKHNSFPVAFKNVDTFFACGGLNRIVADKNIRTQSASTINNKYP
jgi:hypothetical protein